MNERFDKITPGLPAKLALLIDGLFLSGALWLTVHPDVSQWSLLLPVLAFSWFFAAAVLRLYSPCTPRNELDELVLGLLGAAGVTMAVAAARWLLGAPFVPKALLDFGLVVFAATTLSRLFMSRQLWDSSSSQDRVLIVGTGALGRATLTRLTSNEQPATVVGFLHLPNEPLSMVGCDTPVLGSHEQLLEVLIRESISEVYVAGRIMVHGAAMQDVVRTCEEVGVPFALPLHSLAFERATLLASAGGDGFLHYLNTPRKPVDYALKRLVDIALAGTALLLLSPLLLAVAIAIKLTSRGPILFRQVRVGLHGATFNFLKFRSMVVNAEELKEKLIQQALENDSASGKMAYDPRITRIGRFIRKYSIDELPQLVNVLRGDMSIVGPRPALPEEVATYKAWQRRRLSLRPGLTCFWQVQDKTDRSFEKWMRLDLHYVDHWSLRIDFMLMAQTVPVVLLGRSVSNELYVWRG